MKSRLEVGSGPAFGVVGEAEQDVAGPQRRGRQRRRVDGRAPAEIDHQRLTDHAIERDLAEPRGAVDEVVWRVDVRAGVASPS